MTQPSVTVRTSGPFFRLGPQPIADSLHDTIQETVQEGEKQVVAMAQPRGGGGVFHSRQYASAHGYTQTGNYARSINGRMLGSLHGVIRDDREGGGPSVYGPWLELGGGRFKGYAMFRKTKQKLQGMARKILLKHINKALRRLN
ncbi:MAG: hypothetical protein IIC82_06455 [Chloroflexi bacterium]|nr:hypothetical protein [Chloroflexota bacterium]